MSAFPFEAPGDHDDCSMTVAMLHKRDAVRALLCLVNSLRRLGLFLFYSEKNQNHN